MASKIGPSAASYLALADNENSLQTYGYIHRYCGFWNDRFLYIHLAFNLCWWSWIEIQWNRTSFHQLNQENTSEHKRLMASIYRAMAFTQAEACNRIHWLCIQSSDVLKHNHMRIISRSCWFLVCVCACLDAVYGSMVQLMQFRQLLIILYAYIVAVVDIRMHGIDLCRLMLLKRAFYG